MPRLLNTIGDFWITLWLVVVAFSLIIAVLTGQVFAILALNGSLGLLIAFVRILKENDD